MSSLPQIKIHQLPTLQGSAVGSDYLMIERNIGNNVYVAYKLALSQINLASFGYVNTALNITTVGGALDRALVPTNVSVVQTTSSYAVNPTSDIATIYLQNGAATVNFSLPGSPTSRPIVLRLIGNGGSDYTGHSTVQFGGGASVSWVQGSPLGGIISVPYSSSVLIVLQFLGATGAPSNLSGWVGMLYGVSSGNLNLSGPYDPKVGGGSGPVPPAAGAMFVNTLTGGLSWSDGVSWLP